MINKWFVANSLSNDDDIRSPSTFAGDHILFLRMGYGELASVVAFEVTYKVTKLLEPRSTHRIQLSVNKYLFLCALLSESLLTALDVAQLVKR